MPAFSPADPIPEGARRLRLRLAANLKRRAEGRGLSLTRLAAHADLPSQVLRDLFRAERSANLATLSRLATALATTTAELISEPESGEA